MIPYITGIYQGKFHHTMANHSPITNTTRGSTENWVDFQNFITLGWKKLVCLEPTIQKSKTRLTYSLYVMGDGPSFIYCWVSCHDCAWPLTPTHALPSSELFLALLSPPYRVPTGQCDVLALAAAGARYPVSVLLRRGWNKTVEWQEVSVGFNYISFKDFISSCVINDNSKTYSFAWTSGWIWNDLEGLPIVRLEGLPPRLSPGVPTFSLQPPGINSGVSRWWFQPRLSHVYI